MEKMRKFWLMMMACIACLSSARATSELRGTHTAADGTAIYLIDMNSKDTLGVTTVNDCRFSFTIETSRPIYAYVGHGRERVHCILEPGTLTVDLDERIASGTPMTDAYNAFHRRFYSYNGQRDKARQALTAIKDSITPEAFNLRWEQIDNEYRSLQGQLTDSIVSRNRDNLLGAIALDDLAYTDTTKFMQLYATMSQEMQAFYILKNDVKTIRQQSLTAPGKLFTDYLVANGNPDGSDVRLSDYVGKGKYILLDHWASWCGPCKAEMPYIKRVWEDFAGKHFDVVSIAVNDKRANTLRALGTLDMPWHQIIDAQSIPLSAYSISAIPHLILFAPDGTILKRGLRGEQIYSTVKQILSEH